MTTEPQQGTVSAAFPAPPPFYKSFTSENLERFQQYLQTSSQSTSQDFDPADPLGRSNHDLTTLSSELRNLIPPKPPADGKYQSFGASYDVTPTAGSTQNIPTREALLGLNERLLQLFLRYVQILATDPSGRLWVPQWEEIRKTFEETHGIVNEYRPHQARETLIRTMEDQIKQLRDETEQVRTSVAKAKTVMDSLATGKEDSASNPRSLGKITARASAEQGDTGAPPKARNSKVWEIVGQHVGDS